MAAPVGGWGGVGGSGYGSTLEELRPNRALAHACTRTLTTAHSLLHVLA